MPKKHGREAISQPFAFEHVQHWGYNKDSQQFDLSGLSDDMLKKFFEDGGLNNLIKSQDDKAFALKCIEENCGLKEPKKLGREAISQPFDFEHVQHLSHNKDSQQFDISGLNGDMLKYSKALKMAPMRPARPPTVTHF